MNSDHSFKSFEGAMQTILLLQQEGVHVNVTIVLSVIGTAVTMSMILGTIVWNLSTKLSQMKQEVELVKAVNSAEMLLMKAELSHLRDTFKLRLDQSDKDAAEILHQLSNLSNDLKGMNGSLTELKTANTVASAVAEVKKRFNTPTQ